MGDKFTIKADTAALSAAETLLGDLSRNIDEEGGKLAALPGKAASWTGGTAKTLKAEMTRLSDQMTKSSPHFTTAQTAVSTFRGKVRPCRGSAHPQPGAAGAPRPLVGRRRDRRCSPRTAPRSR